MHVKNDFCALKYDIIFKFIFGYQENVHYTEWLLEKLYNMPKGTLKGKLKVINSLKLDKNSAHGHGLETDVIVKRLDTGWYYNLEMYASGFNNESQLKSYDYITALYGNQLKVGAKYKKNKRHIQINFIIDKNYPSRHFYVNDPKFNNIEYHKEGIEINIVNIDKCESTFYNFDEDVKKLFKLMKASSELEEKEIVKEVEVLERMQKDMDEFRRDEWFTEYFSKANEWERELKYTAEEKLQEGKNEANLATAKNMLQNNIDVNMVSKCTGLSLKTIKSIVL